MTRVLHHTAILGLAAILCLSPATFGCGPFFYVAPPTLDRYPERIPTKTVRELLREHLPPSDEPATMAELQAEMSALGAALTVEPKEKLLARLEALQARNRHGDYRKRFANYLNDFRDLLQDGGVAEPGAGEYIQARLAAMDWDDGFFATEPHDAPFAHDPQWKARWQAWRDEYEARARKWDEQARTSSETLRPHWLILKGAWAFRYAQFAEAGSIFADICQAWPLHPRSEIAQLMLVRVRIEEWRLLHRLERRSGEQEQQLAAAAESVEQALATYSAHYPNGRFRLDLPGWRGGFLREAGNLYAAISCYLEQMDNPAHPEIGRRAARCLEDCLESMGTEDSESGEWKTLVGELARRPLAALAVVYHYLDSASRERWPAETEAGEEPIISSELGSMLQLRRESRPLIHELAQAVASARPMPGAPWRASQYCLLAWVATQAGDHEVALRLCEVEPKCLRQSDDLQYVRAVALQRAGRLPLARDAYVALRKDFPASPLVEDATFRLISVLRDLKEYGAAIVELSRMPAADGDDTAEPDPKLPIDPSAPERPQPIPAIHPPSEIEQWLDALLQYAPLPELEKSVAALAGEPELAGPVAAMLRWRYLAAERFTDALRYPPPPSERPPASDPKELRYAEASGDGWVALVKKLERLTQAASAGAPEVRAQREWELAETWARARNSLILPFDRATHLTRSEDKQWEQRYRNGLFAGFPRAEVVRELEQRDELRHALPHYLTAAGMLPGTALAARSLWRANDALRLLAGLSSWHAGRAFETSLEAASKSLHQRLLRECPRSPEALRSAWWSFAPPMEVQVSAMTNAHEMEAVIGPLFAEKRRHTADYLSSAGESAFARLQELSDEAMSLDIARVRTKLAELRAGLLKEMSSPDDARILNHFEDLDMFAQEPGMTLAAFRKYLALRLRPEPPGAGDPELAPWADYVAFLAAVRAVGTVDPETGREIVPPIYERMDEFLRRFPHSRKREAALARRAIGLAHAAHGHPGWVESATFDPPELAPDTFAWVADAKLTPAAGDALAEYEALYPHGRYFADIHFWRRVLAMDQANWPETFRVLSETLDDQTHRELHLDAALNLAAVFMRLLEKPDERDALIDALKKVPAAQRRLWLFMHSPTPGARLLPLEGYLRERFAS